MPKIRGIKPEFWTDEDICELSPWARLLFIGMWNYACDNGHLQDKPKQVKRRILPDDDVNASALVAELADCGVIERADGWITIPNFRKHQKLDKRWFQACDKPGCGDSKPETRGGHDEPTTGTHSGHDDAPALPPRHSDVDSDVDSDSDNSPTVSRPRKRGARLPDAWAPSVELRQQMADQCPTVDQHAEYLKFCDFWRAKTGKDATKLDWDATYRNWMRRAAEQKPRGRPGRQQATDDLFDRAAHRLGIAQ